MSVQRTQQQPTTIVRAPEAVSVQDVVVPPVGISSLRGPLRGIPSLLGIAPASTSGFDAVPGQVVVADVVVATNKSVLQSMATRPLVQLEAQFSPAATKRGAAIELPPIGGVALTACVLQVAGQVTNTHPSVLQSLHAACGRLDREQFDQLHAAFGGRSAVPFDAARSYDIVDFLPPVLQALLHQNLAVVETTLKGSKAALAGTYFPPEEDVTLTVTTNCHAAAYEAAAAFQSDKRIVDVFFGNAIAMGQAFGNHVIGSMHHSEILNLDLTQLQPGDVMQFLGGEQLLHSATYVGGGLFFEKPNTEIDGGKTPEETPYRLATAAMITAPVVSSCGDVGVTFARPTVLAAAGEALCSESQGLLEAWAQKKGRSLGVRLVDVVEQSLTGATVGSWVEPVVTRKLKLDKNGRGSLA